MKQPISTKAQQSYGPTQKKAQQSYGPTQKKPNRKPQKHKP
jgi:hypothetical protein